MGALGLLKYLYFQVRMFDDSFGVVGKGTGHIGKSQRRDGFFGFLCCFLSLLYSMNVSAIITIPYGSYLEMDCGILGI